MVKLKKYTIIFISAGLLAVLALFLMIKNQGGKKTEFLKADRERNISAQDGPAEAETSANDASSLPEAGQDESITKAPADATDKTDSPEKTVTSNVDDVTKDDDTKERSSSLKIIDRLVSWGYQKSSGRKIDTIIIHSTYNAVGSDPFDLDDIINKEYKPYGVSPHYIIDRKGKIYRLVGDQNIAYHAGEAKVPDGRTGVNNFSLGIEIVTSNTTKPTDEQYASLKSLVADLKAKYPIKYVLGHKDVAPERKDDPWNFDWNGIK